MMRDRHTQAPSLLRRIRQNVLKFDASRLFDLHLYTAARAIASDHDFRVIPLLSPTLPKPLNEARIGFYGNISNISYNFARCLRKLGLNIELVLQPDYIDKFVMSRPFWEDLVFECDSPDEALQYEHNWLPPDFVKQVPYDKEEHQRYIGLGFSGIAEIQARYRETFGQELPPDRALLLSRKMGHWPYLETMAAYDLILFCFDSIQLGPFCPKPYISMAVGGDLQSKAFEESLNGLLVRAGFRNAVGHVVADRGYPKYFERLGIRNLSQIQWMLDEAVFLEEKDEALYRSWQEKTGGSRFILMACRQDWEDKKNQVFIRAFAQVAKDFPEWRLILANWGRHLEQTRTLLAELGLEEKVIWLSLQSKPSLQRCQVTADLVVDHCAELGIGAATVESLGAGTPVLLRQGPHFKKFMRDVPEPPLITFQNPEELPALLQHWLGHPELLEARGQQSRDWLVSHLSYRMTGGYFIRAFEEAMYRAYCGGLPDDWETMAASSKESEVLE